MGSRGWAGQRSEGGRTEPGGERRGEGPGEDLKAPRGALGAGVASLKPGVLLGLVPALLHPAASVLPAPIPSTAPLPVPPQFRPLSCLDSCSVCPQHRLPWLPSASRRAERICFKMQIRSLGLRLAGFPPTLAGSALVLAQALELWLHLSLV